MAEVLPDEVVTGEAVVLHVPIARFPSRMAALAIDMLTQIVLLLAVIVGMIDSGNALDAASGAAVILTAIVLILVGFPVIWETASRGRSPGKFALGLRVVSDDGSPERFRQALVRGLAGVVEIWMLSGSPALICSLLSSKGKRLGDLFAGTYVIQQRLPTRRPEAYLVVPPYLAAWASTLQLSGLSEQAAESARQYLARMAELRPDTRAQLGAQLATMVNAQVSPPPPPGTPAQVYLAAVLAERRRREQARWLPPGAPLPTAGYPPAPPPHMAGHPLAPTAPPAAYPAPPYLLPAGHPAPPAQPDTGHPAPPAQLDTGHAAPPASYPAAPAAPPAGYQASPGQAVRPLVPPQAPPPTRWTAPGAAPSGPTTSVEDTGTAWRAEAGEGDACEAPTAEGLTPGAHGAPAAGASGFVPPT